MENPLNVDVTLNDGVDQNSFVSEFDSNSNVELLNLLPELTNLVLLKVEKDYFLSVIGDRITKINGNDIRVIGTDVTESIKGNRTVRVAKDDTQTIVKSQTESVGGTKRETVNGPVKENFGDFHATQIKKYRYQDVVDSMMTKVGVNFKVGAGGISEIGSAGNMTIKTLASQIVDVAVDVTETVGGNVSETISGDQTQAITGNLDIDAAQIDLN